MKIIKYLKFNNILHFTLLFLTLLLIIICGFFVIKQYRIFNNIESYENDSNKIKSVALVIPIHPKHYDFIYNLIKNINNRMDIYLIFSNEIDYNNFKEKDKIYKIILPDNTKTESIVSYKKFYALKYHLINSEYNYFIVCDAEIDIINENFTEENILKKINNIYENKIIYGGEVNNDATINITKTSSNLFNDNNYKQLSNITKEFKLYSWWSDIPVYKREYLQEFFDIINFNNIIYDHFDCIIYSHFLLLYKNFTLLNITPLISHSFSLESYQTDDTNMLDKLKEYKYGFSWITSALFNKHKEYLTKEGSFLLYHLDR